MEKRTREITRRAPQGSTKVSKLSQSPLTRARSSRLRSSLQVRPASTSQPPSGHGHGDLGQSAKPMPAVEKARRVAGLFRVGIRSRGAGNTLRHSLIYSAIADLTDDLRVAPRSARSGQVFKGRNDGGCLHLRTDPRKRHSFSSATIGTAKKLLEAGGG